MVVCVFDRDISERPARRSLQEMHDVIANANITYETIGIQLGTPEQNFLSEKISELIARLFGVEKNPTRPFIQDLDSLPLPDREMWQKWILDPISKPWIFLGRGCPFNCAHCSNHAQKKLASGKYVRFRSINNILEEIDDFSTNFPEIEEIRLYFEIILCKNK